jgi:lysine-specific demethylase/histidyl-hydroxylase NO66
MNRYAIVESLLELAADETALRFGFPLGLDVTDPDQLAPHLEATVEALANWLPRIEAANVAERLRERAWPATRPAPIRPLAQAAAMTDLDLDTVLSPRGGLHWQMTAADPDTVTLHLVDRQITVPARCAPALRVLLAGPWIRVGDLPDLAATDQLTFARRMLREAIAVSAEKQ